VKSPSFRERKERPWGTRSPEKGRAPVIITIRKRAASSAKGKRRSKDSIKDKDNQNNSKSGEVRGKKRRETFMTRLSLEPSISILCLASRWGARRAARRRARHGAFKRLFKGGIPTRERKLRRKRKRSSARRSYIMGAVLRPYLESLGQKKVLD